MKTIEELKQQYQKLGQEIRQREQDEEDRRKAQLALEKETRKKEVDEALEHYTKLAKEFIKDFGSYSYKTESSTDHSLSPWFWWF